MKQAAAILGGLLFATQVQASSTCGDFLGWIVATIKQGRDTLKNHPEEAKQVIAPLVVGTVTTAPQIALPVIVLCGNDKSQEHAIQTAISSSDSLLGTTEQRGAAENRIPSRSEFLKLCADDLTAVV